jgi:hypothetical protein
MLHRPGSAGDGLRDAWIALATSLVFSISACSGGESPSKKNPASGAGAASSSGGTTADGGTSSSGGSDTTSGGTTGGAANSAGGSSAGGSASGGSAAGGSSGGDGGELPEPMGKQCIVHLHGKGGGGGPPSVNGDITTLYPSGNAEGWGALQWLYFPDDKYEEVRNIVATAISDAGCGRVIMHGFSNGAAATAKFYCKGERFGNTMIGYIVDDPVTDHAVEGCTPPSGVQLQLYWTGGLAFATAGYDCVAADWTCEGNSTIGIESYSAALATTATPSIHTDHQEYASPPEYESWW